MNIRTIIFGSKFGALFLSFILIFQFSLRAQPATKTVIPEQLVLYVSAFDGMGRSILGLQKEQFTISNDKVVQEIIDFKSSNEPASIVLLVDKTKSMNVDGWRTNQYKFLARGFLEFMDAHHEQNEYALLSFDKSNVLLHDWSTNRQSLVAPLNKFTNEEAHGIADIRDACIAAVEKAKTGKHQRRIVILFSDGWQTQNSANEKKLKQISSDLGVTIFAVKVPSLPFPMSGNISEELIDHIVSPTGGTTFFADSPVALIASFSALTDLLQHQYRITIQRLPFQSEKKWRPLKIELKIPPDSLRTIKSLKIKHSAGYFDRLSKL